MAAEEIGRQPFSLSHFSLEAWKLGIRKAESEEELLFLVSRAPPMFLEKIGHYIAHSFSRLRIGKNFFRMTLRGICVPEIFFVLNEFIRTDDRIARIMLFEFFKLWMDEEYRPLECESPLVKILFENLNRLWKSEFRALMVMFDIALFSQNQRAMMNIDHPIFNGGISRWMM